MNATISILFSGLIAFIPNSSEDHPSFMTAYLLEDQHHIPKITFRGKVCFSSQNGVCRDFPVPGGQCTKVRDYGDGRAEIKCPLGNATDIEVDPEIEQRSTFLRPSPRKAAPESLGEYAYGDWLLRVKNIEIVAGRAHAFGDLESLVGATFRFGWNDMRTCDLDGSEASKIRVFGFKSAEGESDLRQAVTERVMFTANVRTGPMIFTLRDRQDPRKKEFVRADCSENGCLTLDVENSLDRSRQDHFTSYYSIVRRPSQKRIPFLYKELPAPSGNPSLVICGLALLRPLAPDVVREIERVFKSLIAEDEFRSLDELEGAVLPPLVSKLSLTPGQREVASKIFLELNQLQDRIVCPPVIMEP